LDYIIQYKNNLNNWINVPNGNILNTSNNYNTILINNGIITDTIKITSNQSSYYNYSNPIELELIGVPYYNTLQPNNSITLSIDVRSLIPMDYNDYGNITIENIEIPIRIINSNNNIGIMSGLDTNVIIGNTTNKLIINETNGPYQLLSNNPSLQNYTYINKTEYPVTINDIIPLYDNNNASVILIDAEYPITLNTNDYILLSANVIPYNTNIDDFGWLIVTEDGQERILKLFITNVDDNTLYNEIVTIGNNNINISNGRPYDIVNVIGPTTISPFYLANTGIYNITDIDPGTYTLTFGTGHNKTIDLFSNKDVAKEVLGLVIGSNVQAYNANLTNFASLSKTANNFIVANGSSWITTSGSDTRSRLGLSIGTDVQAYNTYLKDIGSLDRSANNLIIANGSSWESKLWYTLPGLKMLYDGSEGIGIQSRSGNGGSFTGGVWNIDYQGWDATYRYKFKIWGWGDDSGYIRTTDDFTASNPEPLGAAAKGTSEFMSRGDHVHPTTACHDILPAANVTYDLGSTTKAWDYVYYRTAIGVSDERYKTDIIDSDLGLDFINELHPVKYKWRKSKVKSKDNNNNIIYTETVGTNFNYGLIADEVGITLGQRDFGGYVEDIESGEKGLVFDQFVAVLIKAVQELTTEFNNEKNIRIELEKRIEKLENINIELEKRIEKLENTKK